MNKKLVLSAIVTILLFSGSILFAQNVSKGDTLIVSPVDENGAPLLGALNMAIHGDTTAAGERVHKVYKLHRGAQYILTEVIQGDFPLVIVADAPDENNRPPVIRCGLTPDGGNVNHWWQLYDDATFKNLWISGINLDGTGGISWIMQTANVPGKTITYEGCIVEAPLTNWAVFNDPGGRNDYIIKDCVFMNIGNPTGTTWNGAVFHSSNMDTVLIENSTFYKFGCFAARGAFHLEINHCSFINCMVHPIDSHNQIKEIIKNSLFVNCHAFSDDFDEIKRHFDQEVKGLMNYAEIQWDPQALDSLYGPGGVYGYQYDPDGDGTLIAEEMIWELKNNNWFYTQPIEDYWAQFDNVIANPWMNNYNKAMFENQEGPWTWTVWTYERDTADVIIDSTQVTVEHEPFKFFVEENTMNVDPGITNMNGTDDLIAQNCINIRTEWAGGTVDNPVKWHGVDSYLAFEWPLPFDLSYANSTLETAGTDGKPIGSLQWWPQYQYTGVESNEVSKPAVFELKQNYPNPFNPSTTINYSLNEKGKVELKVYNILGAEVATLIDKNQNSGDYSITFDGKKLTSGVYFYQLKAGNQTITRKMMLMK